MTRFVSRELADLWRLIAGSVDRLVEVARDLEETGGAEALHWRPPAPAANSVLVLAHHTLENLEDNALYTVAGIDRSAARDREAEFDADDASTARLVARWSALHPRIEQALALLDTAILAETREHPRRGEQSVLTVLVVTARHAAEHLAHAELTRDLYRAAAARS